MVINFRVDLKIAEDRANNFVVGAISSVEHLQLPLKDGEQLYGAA
jgi:hypothetical protein